MKNAPSPESAGKTFRESDWRCPCAKHARLKAVADGFICASPKCHHANPKNKFGMLHGIPILVSTHLCDSVCDPSDIVVYDPTQSKPWRYRLLDSLISQSKVIGRNCQAFVNHLKAKTNKPKVLVVGGGKPGFRTECLWEDEAIEIHSIDIYASPNVDAVADAHYLPLPSDYYDGVWIQNVLEHVVDPWRVVTEVHRVLNKNGIVYNEMPFMTPVHGGAYDFTRFTMLGHRYLFRQFRLMEMGGIKGAEDTLGWTLRHFILAVTRNSKLYTLGYVFDVLLQPFAILVSKKSHYDSASSLYFIGSKSNKSEVNHKQLIKLYNGQYK